MGRLSGKVAIVTGASKGIGADVAKGLAKEGASVIVNYASSTEAAQRVVTAINNEGGKAIAVKGDVPKPTTFNASFPTQRKPSAGSTSSSTTPASTSSAL
jgi:3-oxoacyl-[acyl-carrier protein] reductase